mmetsp:Transcript_20197/g.44047  ORF Transcript_20197/g.44047 Transcript_20197/m.44047 type:complete len:88 (+) Transcript_20197:28-291(+)|eukprot:CAMPEP_0202898396 /NCGR_PEP_ID=MMETSP1392-20130828/6930_1 /ASSEMBLY_ACC=CAM_ASM_000868 /TAXON_ID=225041 /ORGANISM="Chlamydomonas chlamydogama, Strain SAG 11-48b" /LENGTH=87 /DNA_ID=CAMNT_0049584307 /DNA_START=31 /DNA_END=294 /DNA_ORIENTATION=+
MSSQLDEVLGKASDWQGLQSLNVAQDILDRNKLLINEIHRNHDLRTPESLQRNVILIKELNSNVTKVVQLYQELATQIDQPGGDKAI